MASHYTPHLQSSHLHHTFVSSSNVLFMWWVFSTALWPILNSDKKIRSNSQVTLVAKNPPAKCRRHKRCGFKPWVGKIPRRRAQQSTPVFLPGNPMDRGAWGGLQSSGSQRVRHSWSDFAHISTMSLAKKYKARNVP